MTHMTTAAVTGPGRVEIRDQERPAAKGDLVVVQILVAPMCTENKQRRTGDPNETLGHEAAGVVVDAGTSQRVKNGDRVVVMPHYGCGACEFCLAGDYMYCRSQRDVLAETGQSYGTATYAQYILKQDWLLLPVPDDIPLTHAAFACCGLGPSFTAAERTRVDALTTLVVSGCGPVGLGAVVHGVTRGARVLAIESHPYRAALARKLGVEEVIDPRGGEVAARLHELTRGTGADVGIETSGAPRAAWALAESLRPRGRMGIIAWGNDVELPPLVPRGLDIYGCWHWDHRRYASRMWETIRKGGSLLDMMLTHIMPLEDVSAAMDLQDEGECGKVFLLPNPDTFTDDRGVFAGSRA
jgi:threonine dehydrogenase-like Zn-dependent dehydrogenase